MGERGISTFGCPSHAQSCPQPHSAVSSKLPSGLCPPARTDVLGAGVAVLGVQGLKAAAAVGPPILHDVALPPQHRLALEAAEMLHVPVPPFGLGALVGKNDLGEETQVEQSWSEKGTPQTAIFVSPVCAQQLCPFVHATPKFYS